MPLKIWQDDLHISAEAAAAQHLRGLDEGFGVDGVKEAIANALVDVRQYQDRVGAEKHEHAVREDAVHTSVD